MGFRIRTRPKSNFVIEHQVKACIPDGAGVDWRVVASRVTASSWWLGRDCLIVGVVAWIFGLMLFIPFVVDPIRRFFAIPERVTAVLLVGSFIASIMIYCLLVWRLVRRKTWSVVNEMGVRTCVRCGYDLRPTAESQACPECGAARAETKA